MAVYTSVSCNELAGFLSSFDVGELLDYQGIAAGIENTNFFVNTSSGRYVLTLFEKHESEELGFYLDLMLHLAASDILVASPVLSRRGDVLQRLNNKPAALITRLSGRAEPQTATAHCSAIGHELARIHLATLTFPQQHLSDHGHEWRMVTAQQVLTDLDDEDADLLQQEIVFQQSLSTTGLPEGIIHADLFHDNALFNAGRLSGVIDWYFACNDFWLYDLAVVVNDWCCQDDGALDAVKLQSCLTAYHQVRPLTQREFDCWPGLLRAAALRFWLSRLLDVLYPRNGEMVQQKDPAECRDKLQKRINEIELIRSSWPVRL
ncbi:MAG: Homoserine kinase (EC [uncultured Thiotrichaceae bacterium]|uniref:Homoserine kinase n=1 Tax=uncultured Thiotrichaceae bacterium TaxID=298394 RepID=A0A6S6T263_9GAMM|nr:MAG: Homoserine kinase (EC [uncultured Thiotrichaceae bacterium]